MLTREFMIYETLITQSGVPISIRHSGGDRDQVVIIAPGFFQSKETNTFKRIDQDLFKEFDTIAMDFRGHGRSGGAYTFSAKEPEDLRVVTQYAKERYAKVGVLGFSYGGAVAIIEQAGYQNIDSLICVGAPMAPKDIEFHWWKPEAMMSGLRGWMIIRWMRSV